MQIGFSRGGEPTSLALVRNLHTGFVSPQYHVVFDDNFETVFHDGKSDDDLQKICDDLFVNNRDCFVEEEYDDDGVLIEALLLQFREHEAELGAWEQHGLAWRHKWVLIATHHFPQIPLERIQNLHRDYAERIGKAGTPVEFVTIEGAMHKFDQDDTRRFNVRGAQRTLAL